MVSRRLVVRFVFALALGLGLIGPAAAQQHDRFYIFGFVVNPGAYHVTADMTVGDALDTAGGFLPNRKISAIEIVRLVDGETQTTVATLNDFVRNGDTIVVK
jgi:protein involved in polysaccharide export with SLBB domain